MSKTKKIVIFIVIIFSTAIAVSILLFCNISMKMGIYNQNKNNIKHQMPSKVKPTEDKTIVITSVGNILFHEKQLLGAATKDGYDFNPSFAYIKDAILDSDIAIGTAETTLGGANFTGYPTFNSPDAILPAIKNAGINVINYADNHILDKGSYGYFRTLNTTKNNNLDMIGVRSNANEKKYLVKEVKGMKIGIIAYTFETQKKNRVRTINSIEIPSQVNGLINTFNYNELDAFYNDINSNIQDMKKDGAEFIIVALHWGDEYSVKENNTPKNISAKLNEMGVDIVLGGHPHVIEPYDIITNKNGKQTFVVYSQGNFISNQCTEENVTTDTNINPKTEDGIIVRFTLAVTDSGISIKEYNVIPTWVYREPKGNGLFVHRVIPVNDALKDSRKFNIPESVYSRVQRSFDSTREIIGEGKLGIHEIAQGTEN